MIISYISRRRILYLLYSYIWSLFPNLNLFSIFGDKTGFPQISKQNRQIKEDCVIGSKLMKFFPMKEKLQEAQEKLVFQNNFFFLRNIIVVSEFLTWLENISRVLIGLRVGKPFTVCQWEMYDSVTVCTMKLLFISWNDFRGFFSKSSFYFSYV